MKRAVSGLLMGVLLIAGVAAQSDLQPIATVSLSRSEPITLKQLKTRCDAYQREQGRPLTIEEKKKVLDTMINERLVVQAAERDGVRVTDSEVNQQFSALISQQVGREITEADFATLVQRQAGMSLDDFIKMQNGMSLAEYKGFLKNELIAQKYLMAKNEAALAALPRPSDAAIRTQYEKRKLNYVQPDMAKLFLVLVPKSVGETARASITELQAQLKQNPTATEGIRTRSKVEGSGFQVGDLYINKNETAARELGISMDALLKIFAMEKNTVSDVSETDNDFQCFVMVDKYPAKILELSDLIQPGTTTTVYEAIRNELYLTARREHLAASLAQMITDLRKPENFRLLKSGADLDRVMTW